MKTLVISFVLLLVLIVQALGQTDELAQLHGDCSPVDGDGYSFPYFPVDNDTLKILVIFAQFPDDTWDHEGQATYYWPGNLNGIPSWADDIIKPNTTNIGSNNMTAYFKEASRNKFFVIGDVYPTLYWHRNNSAYYKNNSSRLMGKAIVECIEDLDDNINYGDYDKFDPEDFDSDNNKREPDGVIDFILIVHRFHLSVDGFPYTGYAALGGSNERFGLDGLGQPITEFATKDGVTALARFPGSGAISSQINPNSYNTKIATN